MPQIYNFDPRDPMQTASNGLLTARSPVVHPRMPDRGIVHTALQETVNVLPPFQIRSVHSSAFQPVRRYRVAYDSNALWYWRRLFANTLLGTTFRAHRLQDDNRYSAGSRMQPVARYKKVVGYPRATATPPEYGSADARPRAPARSGPVRTVEGLKWLMGGGPRSA